MLSAGCGATEVPRSGPPSPPPRRAPTAPVGDARAPGDAVSVDRYAHLLDDGDADSHGLDEHFPAPEGTPQIVGPGAMLVGYGRGNGGLFDEAGLADSYSFDGCHFFEVTTDATRLVARVACSGGLLGIWRDDAALRAAFASLDPYRIDVVRLDITTGAASDAASFDRPNRNVVATPLFVPGLGELLWARPTEYPGGGGGDYFDVATRPRALIDLGVHRVYALYEHHGLRALVSDTTGAPIMTTRVRTGARRAPTPVSVQRAHRGCANLVLAATPVGALARVPLHEIASGDLDTADVVLRGARWLPSPNVVGDVEVCVGDRIGSDPAPLRIRRPGGAWMEIAPAVYPDQVWVTCTPSSCLALFFTESGWRRVRTTLQGG